MNPNQPVNKYKETRSRFDSYTLKEPNFDSFNIFANSQNRKFFYNDGFHMSYCGVNLKHKNHCPFLHDCDAQEWKRRIMTVNFNKAIRNMTIDELMATYNLIPLALPR